MNKVLLFIFSFLLIESLWAAPCCGGGPAGIPLITGDEQLALRMGLAQVQEEYYIDTYGYRSEKGRDYQLFTLSSSFLLNDRWQAGFLLPLQQTQAEKNIGDLSLNIAYELLPELSYSRWRPKLFVYSGLDLPTGRSTFDNPTSEDQISGLGYYRAALGALAVKAMAKIDWNAGFKVVRGIERENSGDVISYQGSFGLGYSLRPARLFSALNANYERIDQDQFRQWWSWSAGVSAELAAEKLLALTFEDQGLVGRPLNTSPQKIISLNIIFSQLR